MMDWTKYPPLPPTPLLPEWRDTPEREAYWSERNASAWSSWSIPRSGCLPWAGLVLAGFVLLLVMFPGLCKEWPMAVLLAFFASGPAMILYAIAAHILTVWKLNRKYSGYPGELQRPDLAPVVKKILDTRPEFSEAEFRTYWPDAERAEIALTLRKLADDSWVLHSKMLYPNDPALFLTLGIPGSSPGDLYVPDEDFCGDVFARFGVVFAEPACYYETSYAELVERCLENKKQIRKKSAGYR